MTFSRPAGLIDFLERCVKEFTPLTEGMESCEYIWLKNAGVELMQGYFFARFGFERLPVVDFQSY